MLISLDNIEEGIKTGARIEAKRDMAIRMLFEGVGIEKVAKLTRLTEEYVGTIRAFYETHDYDPDVAPLTMVSIERIEM